MRVSASLLKTWQGCPLRAKFLEIEARPEAVNAKTVFGTLIHKCLEEYNINGDVDEAIRLWKQVWSNPGAYDRTPDFYPPRSSHRGYMGKGIEILKAYHEKQQWVKRQVLATEHRFLVPFGGHEIKGFIDNLELRQVKGNTQLVIVDYKTASRQASPLQIRQDVAFTCYEWATHQPEFWMGWPEKGYHGVADGEYWYEQLKDVERRCSWYGLWMNKEFNAGDRNENDYLRLHRLIDMIEKAKKYDVFVPNISGESCTFCSYHEPCGLPLPQEVAALDAD